MTLKEANEELERLDNEYNYWLNEKERLFLLVSPKSMDIRPEMVEGGKRVDRLALYVESMDEKKINETLDYIQSRKQNLMNWMDQELKILGKYNEVEKLIVFYKEVDTKSRTWVEISRLVHYSESHCKRIYKNYKHLRNI